jgi:hypothetical protein
MSRYTEQEVLIFEEAMGITLPFAYRDYIISHGVGEYLLRLDEWHAPYDPEDMPADFLSRRSSYAFQLRSAAESHFYIIQLGLLLIQSRTVSWT